MYNNFMEKEMRIVDRYNKWIMEISKEMFLKMGLTLAIIGFVAMWGVASHMKNEITDLKSQIVISKTDQQSLYTQLESKDSLMVEYRNQRDNVRDFVRTMFTTNYYTTRLTGYHPVVEQTDSTPDITADGTKFNIEIAGEYRYVALSRDLLTTFNKTGANISYGDYVLIKGTPNAGYDGIYHVRDTMNKRHKEWIDILLTPGQQSFYYKNILLYKINNENLTILRDIYNHFPSDNPISSI